MNSYNKKALIVNGPNLNLLGKREKEIYGDFTLSDIIEYTNNKLRGFSVEIKWYQSNIEGGIINRIQEAIFENIDILIINPAAYTHTSVAIYDALCAFKGKIIEVHISNTNKRESFRRNKITTMAANAVIEGFGKDSYYLAIYSQLDVN